MRRTKHQDLVQVLDASHWNHSRFRSLRNDLTEIGLRNFLLDEERIGTVCTKYRSADKNGWSFPPLAEAREAWERCYGTVKWDNPDVKEWGDAPKDAPGVARGG